jgi:hypothetical protein
MTARFLVKMLFLIWVGTAVDALFLAYVFSTNLVYLEAQTPFTLTRCFQIYLVLSPISILLTWMMFHLGKRGGTGSSY